MNSDDIVAQTVINDSNNTVFNILNDNNISHNSCGDDKDVPPKTIDFPKFTITTTIDEEVNTPRTSTDICEKHLTAGNETHINKIF